MEYPKRDIVIALDLEKTLVSNAVSLFPRPHLNFFLESVKEMFDRIVVYTTVPEERFRKIATLLATEMAVPSWFPSIEYVSWSGKTKDLSFVPDVDPNSFFLVDDFPGYVHPGQEQQYIKAKPFEAPYSPKDQGLIEVLDTLKKKFKKEDPSLENLIKKPRRVRCLTALIEHQEKSDRSTSK